MDIPNDLLFTKTHEWIRNLGSTIEVGITDFAQNQLMDITHVELPELHAHFRAGEELASVESTKAFSEIYAPVDGTVDEVNTDLSQSPELINTDPYGQAWIYRMTPLAMDDINALMSAQEYAEFAESEQDAS